MPYGHHHESERQQLVALKPKGISHLNPEVAVARAIAEFRDAYRTMPAQSNREGALAANSQYGANGAENQLSSWASGRRYLTRAGFRTRSKIEKIIADFLHIEGFKFIYEPLLQVGEHWVCPDFYLTELELPYEHFGLATHDYQRQAEVKIARYVGAGVPFVYTTYNDEPDIEDVLTEKLIEFY